MLMGLLEPEMPAGPSAADAVATPGGSASAASPEQAELPAEPLLSYPLAYVLRIVATSIAILMVFPVWRSSRMHASWLAVVVGAVGGVAWILICRLKLEDQLLTAVGLADWTTMGDRPALNPFVAFAGAPVTMVAFLTVRFVGLAVIVPLMEEFFLRGFVMRFFLKPQWWTIPLGTVTWSAAVIATVYGVLAHPAEPLAAAIWFSLITLLYAGTKNIWDCVLAHAVTNGMLGVYVLVWHDWTLW